MNDKEALTALYFGMVATSANAHGMSLDACWTRAAALAAYAETKTNGKTDQSQVRVR